MVFGLMAAAVALGQAEPVVAGYLPAWKFSQIREAAYRRSTDLIYFSIEPTKEGGLNLEDMEVSHLEELKKKKAEHGFRLLLCVGGWGRSEHFAAVSADAGLRKRFVGELVALAETYDLDGIDLDWEHPKDAKESGDYSTLMKDLKAGLGPRRIVTAALAGWQTLTADGWATLDRLHLMAYDRPGEHATYDGALEDVATVVKKGMPKGKVAMGVPFYGRQVGGERGSKTASELLAGAGVGRSVDLVDGYYLNNLDTLEKKGRYARAEGLAGVMIWEVTQDLPDGRLIEALWRSVNGRR